MSTPFPTPLVPGFNPDPSITLGPDGWYYLVTSTFEYVPGLPIYRSRDLVEWEQIGNVITRQDQLQLDPPHANTGVYAPTIRYHANRFYVVVTVLLSPLGNVVFSADDPTGPWTLTTLDGIDGIDPDLSWDEEGHAYITFSGLMFRGPLAGQSHQGILQARVDLDEGRTLEEPRSLWSGSGHQFPEAPHVFTRGGAWYLMIAEGGTERGHSVSIARGESITGPFSANPANPILTARASDRLIQNTGHADIVPGPDGQDVLVLLGVRTIGRFFSPIGRQTFATNIRWVDGWPQADPILEHDRDEPIEIDFPLDGAEDLADPGWLAVGRAPASLATITERGLELTAGDDNAPIGGRFIGRRQGHLTSTFTVQVEPGAGAGGLAIRWDDTSFVAVSARTVPDGTEVTVVASLVGFDRTWTRTVQGGPVTLGVETLIPEPVHPLLPVISDHIRLFVEAPARVDLVELDGRYWSAEASIGFSGRVTGMFASAGTVRFRDFRYQGAGA